MLSPRLIAISKLVKKNKVVFDVGSDHSLLPIFLVKEGICPKAYAGDNKVGPLNKGKINIEKFHLTNKVIPVLCDGVDSNLSDIDVVVIAGMGYHSIEHILNNCDINKFAYFIVQANNGVDLLRKYISEHHYKIIDEVMVYDTFYYQIIVFNKDFSEKLSDLEIKYGPIFLKRREELFLKYLENKKEKLIEINQKANAEKYCATILEIDKILSEGEDYE